MSTGGNRTIFDDSDQPSSAKPVPSDVEGGLNSSLQNRDTVGGNQNTDSVGSHSWHSSDSQIHDGGSQKPFGSSVLNAPSKKVAGECLVGNISSDEEGSDTKIVATFRGVDAGIVLHFFEDDLKKIDSDYGGITSRQPSHGQAEQVQVKCNSTKDTVLIQKCVGDLKRQLVDFVKDSVAFRYKHDVAKQFVKENGGNSKVLFYLNEKEKQVEIVGQVYKDVKSGKHQLNAHLKEHSAVHTTVRSFQCHICGQMFKTRSVQRRHQQNIHFNPRSHKCSHCNKEFNTKYAFQRHLRIHDGDPADHPPTQIQPSMAVDEKADTEQQVELEDENMSAIQTITLVPENLNEYRQTLETVSDQSTSGIGEIYIQVKKRSKSHSPERQAKPKDESREPSEWYIFVKNMKADNRENLMHYIEAGTGSNAIQDKLIYNEAKCMALVVLDSKPDMDKLNKRVEEKPLGGDYISVSEVGPPSTIAVSSEGDLKLFSLGLYFESAKNGGGEVDGEGTEAEDKSCYIIRFKDARVVQSVCGRSRHHFERQTLRVSPCYECKNDAIWDTELHPVPVQEPISIQLPCNQTEFVIQFCKQMLEAAMQKTDCSVCIEDETITLTCTLTPCLADYRKQLKAWPSKAKQCFDEFIVENLTERSMTIQEHVWQEHFIQSGTEQFQTAWETFKVNGTSFDIDTSVHLVPCFVQFCFQKRTQYTCLLLQKANMGIVKVPVANNTATCTISIPVKLSNNEEIHQYVVDTFINLTEGVDFLEIDKNTPQYIAVVEGQSDLLPDIQRNKLEIYNGSAGLYVVGEKKVVQLLREQLFPVTLKQSDDLQGNLAWKTDVDQHLLNRLGTICVKPNTGKPEWRKTTDFFDPNAFYFGWTTNKDYFVDKLKEKKVEISIHDSNGIECRLMISSQNSSEALSNIGKVISEVLLSDYESVTMKIGTTEEEVFTRMLQDSIPDAIDSEDVIVFSDKATDRLCMVGLKDDVCQLWDKLQKLVKRKDITNTAIKYGWESDFVIIKTGEDTTTLPSDIQCCVLQYHLTGNKQTRAIQLLEKESIKTEVTAKSCCLYTTVDMDMKSTTKTVVKAVEDKLVPDLKITHFDKMSTEAKKLINFLKETTPSDLKRGYVEVYHYASTGTICVIGKEAKCTDFLQTVGLSLSSVQEKEFADSKHAIQKTQVAAAQGGTLPDQATTMGQSKSISLQNKPNKSDGEVLNTQRPDHQTERVNHFDCSKEAFACLQDLNFKKYFDDTELTKCVGINLEKFPGTITGDSNYFEKVREKAAEFLKRTKQENVKFNNRQCHKLLLNDNGSYNETVIQFLKDCVKQNKQIKTKPDFSLKVSPDGEVIVTCRDESSCSTVAKVMAKCITCYTYGADTEQFFSNQFKPDWMNKVKTFIEEKCMIILCTEDISIDVMVTFGSIYESLETDFPSIIVKYLGKYGKTLVNEISIEVKALIDVVPGVGLKVIGSDSQRKKIKTRLKQTIRGLRKSIPVNVTDEEIQKCTVEVDGIADRLNCCWKMQSTKVSKERQLQNSLNIAKWFDPLGTLQLTVVQGIAEDVDFDALVYLTSDYLFPHDECPDGVHYFLRRAGDSHQTAVSAAVKQRGEFCPGDIYRYPKVIGDIKAKSLWNIVVLSVKHRTKLSYRDLPSKISETLWKLDSEHVTVAFKASDITQYLGLNEMVQAVFDGYKIFYEKKSSPKVQVYLCCFKETLKDVTKCVNKCFKSWHGFGRTIFDESIKGFQNQENEVKISVEFDSIVQAKVDVIVNAVAPSLDLTKGVVSKQILDKAGPDIQEECYSKAKNYLANGDIVITKSYRIRGKKHVIHGAVAVYHLQTFQDHIKQFVKKCLFETERLEGCKNVAFPALGVGNLKYPRRETACAMFDAIEEFKSEVITPSITEIKVVLYEGDSPTCQAFCDEEWRRSNKCGTIPKSVIKQSVKYLKLQVFEFGAVDIVVALREDIRMSPYAVEAIFDQQWKQGDKLKYASKKPYTWNDQLHIGIKEPSVSAVKDGMARCLMLSEVERVTEIIIDPSKVRVPMSLQVQTIVDQIKVDQTKLRKNMYLRTAYIVVDNAGYADILAKDVNHRWCETTVDPGSQSKTTIELIGDSAKLDEAEKAIKDVLQKMKGKLKPVIPDVSQKDSDGKITDTSDEYGGA